MPIFQAGQRVSYRSNPLLRGRIDRVSTVQGGHQYYEVLWDGGSLEAIAEEFLQEETILQNPWDMLANNALNDYRDFSIASTFHKVRNTTANTISTLKASRTLFKPYQYVPLVKFLQSNLKRILIADEVGLGKTIEAGHIMLEMAARGNLRNTLIVCTNSLKEKWKTELQEKFNFTLRIYESAHQLIQDLNDDMAGSKQTVFGILNYEKSRNRELQQLLDRATYRFDLLICDEAHKIRNSETAQHKGVAKLTEYSDAVIFMTATPIMTDKRNLHSLLRLLDPETFDTYDIFNNAIEQNKPFIRALRSMGTAGSDLSVIAKQLNDTIVVQEMTADGEVYSSTQTTVGQLFQSDQLYQRVLDRLRAGPDTPETRASIQQDLVDLNTLNHIYCRTRKRDVMTDNEIVSRSPHTIRVNLSDEERAVYNAVVDTYDDPDSLGLIQRKRMMSSCIVAFQTPRANLEAGRYDQTLPDSKLGAIMAILDEVVIKQGRKLIVFAFFTNTLLYLRCKLEEAGINCEIIYGGIPERTEPVERFRTDPTIKVLLSSEVGSEGIDLQFCDAIVNYDLPWNPMVVEQRIGRIDRIGQASRVINIYNLIISDTIEDRIYTRLYERINLFRESIGDLEEILGDEENLGELISKGIDSLYRTRLSIVQQEEELSRLALAIENGRLTLERINSQLQEAFINDFHFQKEIESITRNNRYLTSYEILKYLESIVRHQLPFVKVTPRGASLSEIEMPANGTNALFDFIEEYKDKGIVNPEIENLYKRFKIRHYNARTILVTYDQQVAYGRRDVEYISAFHPLINAITNYFEEAGIQRNQAHKLSIRRELLEEHTLPHEYYFLLVYKFSIRKDPGDHKPFELHQLMALLVDLSGTHPVVLPGEIGDYVFGIAQMYGDRLSQEPQLNLDAIDEVRNVVSARILEVQDRLKTDEELKFRSAVNRRADQEIKYIDKKLERAHQLLGQEKGIKAILSKDIELMVKKKQKVLTAKSKAFLSVRHELISASLLHVI